MTVAQGEWGKKLLERIRNEFAMMYTPAGPDDYQFQYDPDQPNQLIFDGWIHSDCGFAECIEAIIRGALAGEPDLLIELM